MVLAIILTLNLVHSGKLLSLILVSTSWIHSMHWITKVISTVVSCTIADTQVSTINICLTVCVIIMYQVI